ncbi:hypothetical protein P3X46_019918 [Hevea brasiliensis]|uniref:Reverse transcriptase domain-containing protein n=1 Tax=Hevea brasiliensis TaxID=3981 RepID=A0ABQ9LM73_HEVBR|nr:hypothetical protein P3X46_019918 [Hevea brasiliensis]
MWIQEVGHDIKWPRKLKADNLGRRDQNKYCHFHDDHGHTTDECRQLKDEIEWLIREGSLKKFARDGKTHRKEESLANKEPPKPNLEELVGIINVIAGGLDECKVRGKRPAKAIKFSQ